MAFWQGGSGNDKKTGGAGVDIFFGMEGNDTLNGGGGNDALDGNVGNDVLIGGAGHDSLTMLGNDTLTGGTGMDFFVAVGSVFDLRMPVSEVTITDFKAKGPAHDHLQLSLFGIDWKDRDADKGDGFSMVKSGRNVVISLEDAGGNEMKITLKNVALADLSLQNIDIIALPGPFNAAAAEPEIWLGTDEPDDKTGTRKADFLIGAGGNDTLRGGGGADQLNGQSGADLQLGGAGDDRIYTSGGDRVTGGAGSDTFVFLSAAAFPDITDPGRAIVTDFTATGLGADQIELVGFDVSFADGDKGLDDGFEMVQFNGDVRMRLLDSDGDVLNFVLKGVQLADLGAGNFDFIPL